MDIFTGIHGIDCDLWVGLLLVRGCDFGITFVNGMALNDF